MRDLTTLQFRSDYVQYEVSIVYVGQYLSMQMLVLRDPADAASIQELEVLQSRAIRIVKSIKGRHGITDGRTALGLQEQKDRRKFHRFALMTEILLEDEKHAVLSSAYSEIVNDWNQKSMTTRAAATQGRAYISLC